VKLPLPVPCMSLFQPFRPAVFIKFGQVLPFAVFSVAQQLKSGLGLLIIEVSRCRSRCLPPSLSHTHAHARTVGFLCKSNELVAEVTIYATHNKRKRGISMPSARFELAIPAIERQQRSYGLILSKIEMILFPEFKVTFLARYFVQHFISVCDSFCVVLVSSEALEFMRSSLCASDPRFNEILLHRHF
jgi:hypothetical protein